MFDNKFDIQDVILNLNDINSNVTNKIEYRKKVL